MKSMKPINMSTLLLAGWAACGVPAVTLAAAPKAPVSAYDQLDQLRSQNAILREQVKQLELKKALSNDEVKKPEGAVLAIPARTKGTPAVQESFSYSAAQVQMVSGAGKNLTAAIALQNGSQVSVQVGSSVPGVGQVKSISLNEVVVDNGGRRHSIPFAVPEAPAQPSQGMQGMPTVMLPSMPPLPPLPPTMTNRGTR